MGRCLSTVWNIDWSKSETLIVRVNLVRLAPIQKELLVAYLDKNREKTLLQISDELRISAFGGGDAPVMPLHVSVSMKTLGSLSKQLLLQKKRVVEEPVHGPFRPSVYEDPVFVAQYTKARYESRVAEVKSILATLGRVHLIAPGDGAGVAYQAVLQLQHQGHKISVESFDSSQEMCDVANRLGNIVKKATLRECLLRYRGCVFFLSHVTDYMEDELIFDYAGEKTIVYGRAIKFPACCNFVPYDKDWGYQLCSSNFNLSGVVLGMAPRIVPEIDYTVFSSPATIDERMIEIDLDEPLYVENARELGLVISEQAKVVVTMDLCPKKKIVAMPGVGLIGGSYGHDLFIVPPLETESFVECHSLPIFENPTHISPRFFFSGESVRTNDGSRSVAHGGIKRGSLTYFNIARKFWSGVVELDKCVCKGRSPHFHCLKIVPPGRAVWQNLVSVTKRHNSGRATREQLYANYVKARLDNSEEVEAMFRHMERVDKVEYENGTGLYHRTGE